MAANKSQIKALVLHSGGIDSTTCLYHAAHDFGAKNVAALSVDYGQRHRREIHASDEICKNLGCEHHVTKIMLPDSMLSADSDQEVPRAAYDELEGVSPTYVPFRNGTMLSHITAIASAAGAEAVYFGAHAEDAQNWAYPDCTPEFIGAMANAIYIGTYRQVRLHTPLEWLRKTDIILMGNAMGVPFEMTWSCYKGGNLHCGECPTCLSRHQGFLKAQIEDPTKYETNPTDVLKEKGLL